MAAFIKLPKHIEDAAAAIFDDERKKPPRDGSVIGSPVVLLRADPQVEAEVVRRLNAERQSGKWDAMKRWLHGGKGAS